MTLPPPRQVYCVTPFFTSALQQQSVLLCAVWLLGTEPTPGKLSVMDRAAGGAMARALVASSLILARLSSRCSGFVAPGIGEEWSVCGCTYTVKLVCVTHPTGMNLRSCYGVEAVGPSTTAGGRGLPFVPGSLGSHVVAFGVCGVLNGCFNFRDPAAVRSLWKQKT